MSHHEWRPVTRTSCLGVCEAHLSEEREPLAPLEREKLLLLEEAMMLFLCLMLWFPPCAADTDMLADRDELEGEEAAAEPRQGQLVGAEPFRAPGTEWLVCGETYGAARRFGILQTSTSGSALIKTWFGANLGSVDAVCFCFPHLLPQIQGFSFRILPLMSVVVVAITTRRYPHTPPTPCACVSELNSCTAATEL